MLKHKLDDVGNKKPISFNLFLIVRGKTLIFWFQGWAVLIVHWVLFWFYLVLVGFSWLVCAHPKLVLFVPKKWGECGSSISHCSMASDMWAMVFGMFEVQWVMPKLIMDLFSCWMGWFRRHDSVLVWKMIPHCLIWCLWRERNARHFEDSERHLHELKSLFFHTLFEWVLGSGVSSIHSILELIDLCKF